jgi:hypothetical protein
VLGASSTYRIIREDIKLFPYRIQMQQALFEADKARKVDFYGDLMMLLEDNAAVLQSIWLSDEAHFHLSGFVNKQNMRVWASEHPHNIMETPLHPQDARCVALCQQMVLLGQFVSTILWLLIVISVSSDKKFFLFSKG